MSHRDGLAGRPGDPRHELRCDSGAAFRLHHHPVPPRDECWRRPVTIRNTRDPCGIGVGSPILADHSRESLNTLLGRAEQHALEAIDWYLR